MQLDGPGVAVVLSGLASMKFQTWCVSGRRDVMNDCREGEHTLIWQKAKSNSSASCASASR